MKKFFHVVAKGSVKGSVFTENHADAIEFYDRCKENKATVSFSVLNEKQAEEYRQSFLVKKVSVLEE